MTEAFWWTLSTNEDLGRWKDRQDDLAGTGFWGRLMCLFSLIYFEKIVHTLFEIVHRSINRNQNRGPR